MNEKLLNTVVSQIPLVNENIQLLPKGANKMVNQFLPTLQKYESLKAITSKTLFSESEAADFLGMKKKELKDLIKNKEINLQDSKIFYKSDLENFLEKTKKNSQVESDLDSIERSLEILLPLLEMYVLYIQEKIKKNK